MIKVIWLLKSIDDKVLLTNEQTDNAVSRVAFATENIRKNQYPETKHSLMKTY